MQPYTPHGDSNIDLMKRIVALIRCNLIPLALCRFLRRTYRCLQKPERCASRGSLFLPLAAVAAAAPHGDSNDLRHPIGFLSRDATLYPSRGQ